jgi:hypothetical protein
MTIAERISSPGTGKLGNDDDAATRITTRGNEAVTFVRGSFKSRSSNLTKPVTRKCDELEAKLAELKSSAARAFSQGPERVEEMVGWQREKQRFYLLQSI